MNYSMRWRKSKRSLLTFTAAQHHQLLEWAAAGRPYEVCGVLAGSANRVAGLIPLPNSATDPRTRYLIAPEAFIPAYYAIERDGQELIGIVHSHPTSAPIPSPTDLREATWTAIFYVIIGFVAEVPSLRAWQLHWGEATEIEVQIEDH
jgi:proteasome lid subunit RPN8/RPN11